MEEADIPQEAAKTDHPESDKKRVSTYKFLNQFNRYLALTTSILVKMLLLVLFFIASIYLYQELSDNSYHISEIRLPQKISEQGYTGTTLATKLEAHIRMYIHGAHFTWSKKEVERYNKSDSKSQIQVEVAGLGFTPQTITKAIREMLGLPRKEIMGDVIISDSSLLFKITIDKNALETVEVPIGKNLDAPLDDLLRKGALQIVEDTEPLVAGVLFAGNYTIGNTQNDPEKAIRMFRNTIGSRPDQESLAYAWWARVLWAEHRDSVEALEKINKAFRIDPDNALAYRTKSTIMYQTGNLMEAEKLMKKSLELDPTSSSGWATLATRYRALNGQKDAEAILAYRKAIKLDPDNMYEFELAWLLARNKDYKQALEVIEDKENQGTMRSDMEGLKYACMIGQGDSVRADVILQKIKAKDVMADAINRLAYDFELTGRLEDAMDFVLLAIKIDSTVAISYTTLAEIFGLKSNDAEFYKNLEKALALGYNVEEIKATKDEPYRSYANQEQFKNLLSKYSK